MNRPSIPVWLAAIFSIRPRYLALLDVPVQGWTGNVVESHEVAIPQAAWLVNANNGGDWLHTETPVR